MGVLTHPLEALASHWILNLDAVDMAEGKWCANTAGYGISGKTDDFTHGVQHSRLTTEEGGSCLQRALCSPEGMLRWRG